MREIKFRAWTGATLEYNVIAGVFGTFFVNPGAKNNGLDERDSASLSPFNTIYPPTTPVMQFTGLKDKNGREIYEGDIVKYKATDNLFPVAFTDGQFLFDEGDQGLTSRRYMTIFPHNLVCEVVGNIYENPDLLKQEV